MSWTGFGSLDLSGVQEAGAPRLRPGAYIVRAADASVEQIPNTQNRKVVVKFEDEGNAGEIVEHFNVFHTSDQAQEIGLRQLKSYLVCAGHPSPDKPADIASLKGLRVGIIVDEGKPYRDRQGNMRTSTEIKRFFDPAKPVTYTPAAKPKTNGAALSQQSQAPARSTFNDEIPF